MNIYNILEIYEHCKSLMKDSFNEKNKEFAQTNEWNFPGAANVADFKPISMELLISKYGKPDFKMWKKVIYDQVKYINKRINSKWKIDGGLYLHAIETMGKYKHTTHIMNSMVASDIGNLRKAKTIFNFVFPNAKIYIVWCGNLTRDTKYFQKGQKVRYYLWGHNTFELRGGWLGFNRKTKKYEVHNIYSKYIKNLRLKLTGRAVDSFTFF